MVGGLGVALEVVSSVALLRGAAQLPCGWVAGVFTRLPPGSRDIFSDGVRRT